MSSINYKPRSGSLQSNEQLHDKIKELEAELARTRAEHNAMLTEQDEMRAAMRTSWAVVTHLKSHYLQHFS